MYERSRVNVRVERGSILTFTRDLSYFETILEPLYGYLRTSISSRFFHEIVNFSTKSSLVYRKWFCLVALRVCEIHFHFESDTSDYITTLNSSMMKTTIQFTR